MANAARQKPESTSALYGWIRTAADVKVAEGAGFEPAIRLPVYTLSRRAPSTTRPPLLARLFAAERTLTNRFSPRNAAGQRRVARGGRQCAGTSPSAVQCCRCLAATRYA